MTGAHIYRMKARTDLWTGDADGKPGRTIPTGLVGSIRWWFEVVVRGLGGSACDPSNTGNRCPDRQGRRCVACELFGCTGWARKFRFDVLDHQGSIQQAQIKRDTAFLLRFMPLRPVAPEEWALLDLSLRLIAGCGALGGKTVYKPSDEPGRENAAHHKDYGLVAIEGPPKPKVEPKSKDELRAYLGASRWRRVDHDGFAWASLEHFWCVPDRYLARQSANESRFNRVMGRPEPKRQSSRNDSWLAGRRAGSGRQPESKKVFSFRDPPRTFGFTDGGQADLETIKTRLRQAWQDDGFDDSEIRDGSAILAELLGGADR